MVIATHWIYEALKEAGTCVDCQHETFTDGCDCMHGDCICFQTRKPGLIWCSTCAFSPQHADSGIYEKFGTAPLTYAEQWYEHVRELHMAHDGAHEPNWHPDD